MPTNVRGRTGHESFEDFYGRHRGALRAYMSRHLRGRIELDDAMQEGLIRISSAFDDWAPEDRLAYAKRALRCAAYDGLRRELGTDARPEVIVLDPSAWDAAGDRAAGATARALDGLAHGRPTGQTEVVERGALFDLLRVLRPEEVRVLFGIAHVGNTPLEVAARLGLSPGRVAYLYDEARWLLRSLVRHARGDEPSRSERRALVDLKHGRLTGRERRRARRHLDHCVACRSTEVVEGCGRAPKAAT